MKSSLVEAAAEDVRFHVPAGGAGRPCPPVVLVVFNRPEFTAQVLDRIRAARPARLFVVADGPRPDRAGEADLCRAVRDLVERGIDWPCEVIRDYAESNLGCDRRISSGLTRAFDQVEEAIVLEDDCLPEPSFFRFCAELLERHRNEGRIWAISGSNHQYRFSDRPESYYFSIYNHIWGWATWRRAWRHFDYSMADWPRFRAEGALEAWVPRRRAARYWREIFDRAHDGRARSWDYTWTFACWNHRALTVLPRDPLVKNLGFGASATHTVDAPLWMVEAETRPASFPLVHPCALAPDEAADARTEEILFRRPTLAERLFRRARKAWRSLQLK